MGTVKGQDWLTFSRKSYPCSHLDMVSNMECVYYRRA